MDIYTTLKEKFGFEQFRPGQEEVIRDVLAKNDQIAILPTGSGKSLCFQLPAYLMDGTVVIISPLVALMEDQVAILKQQGEKRVVALNSFHTYQERSRMINQLEWYKFIFISPEMLTVPAVANKMKKLKIAFIVVDEAHCISQWGFDFRPDYLRVSEFLHAVKNPTVLALTATADRKVIQDIQHYLNLINPVLHKKSLDRPNISYTIHELTSEQAKTDWLIDRVEQTTGPGIIYVGSRKRADELAQVLNELIGGVSSYHAGMEQEDRAFVQAQFISGDLNWICATNAFGMGIHKNDVRQVIHEHIPSTIANYMQEVGRAGRDGECSAASLLYTIEDIQKTRFIMYDDYPDEGEFRYFANCLAETKSVHEAAELARLSETGRRMLLYYFERMSVEETIIQINKQSQEKERQLQQMVDLIQARTCIRVKLLQNFGEDLQKKPKTCCSICDTTSVDWLYSKDARQDERGWGDWSTRLTNLLG